MAFLEVDHGEERWGGGLDGRELFHSRHGIEDEHAAPAEEPDVVVEGIFVTAVELQLFGPVHFVGAFVVAGWSGPADELDTSEALFFAFLAGFGGGFLHFFEELGVVDFFGVVVFDVAVFVVGEDDGPSGSAGGADVGGDEHAEGFCAWGISPNFREHDFGVGGVEEAEAIGEVDFSDPALEGDLAVLVLETLGNFLEIGAKGGLIGGGSFGGIFGEERGKDREKNEEEAWDFHGDDGGG